MRSLRVVSVLVWFVLFCRTLAATPFYTVSFDDPGTVLSPFYSAITSNLMAAGTYWNQFLGGQSASLDLLVKFDPFVPTATGGAGTVVFEHNNGIYNIFEPGIVAELKTGVDPNGSAPDGIITIGLSYLSNELWFDPNPFARSGAMPFNRTDAESVFIHELGHIFGFNGFLNSFTGLPPSNFMSTYDQYVQFDGSNLFFTGPQAEAVYGGPVPLTFGNYAHVGNPSPRPGEDLIPDLMNGVVYQRGTRYSISPLDLAILSDTGVPINAVPEPAASVLIGAGLICLLAVRRYSVTLTGNAHPKRR